MIETNKNGTDDESVNVPSTASRDAREKEKSTAEAEANKQVILRVAKLLQRCASIPEHLKGQLPFKATMEILENEMLNN